MLSHLRKWFRPHSTQPAPRNRIGAPRFRGQIEQLEVRTVLSASFGTSVVDFETGHSGLWEDVVTAQTASRTGISSFTAVTAAHWEDSPSSGLSNRHSSPERYEAVNGAGGNGGPLTLLISKPVDAVLVVTVMCPQSALGASSHGLGSGFYADFQAADCGNEPRPHIAVRMALGAVAECSVPSRHYRFIPTAASDTIQLYGQPDFNARFECPRAWFGV